MQKRNLDFSLLKFKKQVKILYKDLLIFFFFVLYNGFVICQLYTINKYNASKYYFYYICVYI